MCLTQNTKAVYLFDKRLFLIQATHLSQNLETITFYAHILRNFMRRRVDAPEERDFFEDAELIIQDVSSKESVCPSRLLRSSAAHKIYCL